MLISVMTAYLMVFAYDDVVEQASVATVFNPKRANILIGGFTPTFVIKPSNNYKNSSSKVPTFINNLNSASQFSYWMVLSLMLIFIHLTARLYQKAVFKALLTGHILFRQEDIYGKPATKTVPLEK